ncbi:hypothetical protein OHF10_24230, partial [Escherichia coli]|nr:hypothetical protein [Escherichia coli]
PDGAVSGMPAIRETGPGKNLQAITVSTKLLIYKPLQAEPGVHAASDMNKAQVVAINRGSF